jgi:hypothetical protein
MTKRVVGYFENWAQYRQAGGKFMPAQINPDFFTHINFAFGLIGFVTWSVDPSPTRRLLLLLQLKTVITMQPVGRHSLLRRQNLLWPRRPNYRLRRHR